MAALQYAGNSSFQAGTVGSDYTSGGSSLALSSGHGSRFPSAGDYWIRIENEILKVTARSGDTLTVAGAQDGTSAANHLTGTDVYWVMGAAALNQLRVDIATSMTLSAFDTETTTGTANPNHRSVVHLSDALFTCVWTGSAWEYHFVGRNITRPDDSGFAWVNQGGAATSSANGGVLLTAPSSGSQSMRIRKKAAPSTPYTITASFLSGLIGSNYCSFSLGWRESGSGKLQHLRFIYNSSNNGWSLDLVNSSGATADVAATTYMPIGHIPFPLDLKINDNGTNRISSFRLPGGDWVQYDSRSRTDYITPDEVFWSVDNRISTVAVGATLISWLQS